MAERTTRPTARHRAWASTEHNVTERAAFPPPGSDVHYPDGAAWPTYGT
jgi:hypothetical protein